MTRDAGDPRTGGWIDRFADFGDEATAVVFAGESVGYATLAARAREAAAALEAEGLREGDLVAVLGPPSLAGVVLIHAMLDRGIVLLPVNARLMESEQRAVFADMGVACLLVPTGTQAEGEAVHERSLRLAESVDCGLIGFTGEASLDASAVRLDRQRPDEGSAGAVHIRAAARVRRRAEGAALVLMTSGTSGRPKGAVLTLANLVASAEASARLLGSHAADRWLLCMPIFHIGGLSILVRCARVGASVTLHERFDAEQVVRSLTQDGITRVSWVATMLERVLAVEDERGRPVEAPPGLDLVLLGGGPASQDLLERARARGFPIAPTYGLTEAASQVATRPPEVEGAEGAESDLAAGLVPLPGVALRIVDPAGHVLEAGREGEIEVRGPIVMCGYLDDEEGTRSVLREGWLATGDIGRLDAAGGLRVLDRRSDLIVSGGENVYPAEIEAVLMSAPGVTDAGVIGVSDPEYGARPIAFVVMPDGAGPDLAALEAFCRSKLASYKVPTEFRVRRELPRTASGKLQRRLLDRA